MIKFAGSQQPADIHAGRVYIVGRFVPLMENVPLFTAANHFRARVGRMLGRVDGAKIKDALMRKERRNQPQIMFLDLKA